MKRLLGVVLTAVLCICALSSCGILGFRHIGYRDAETEKLLMDGYAPQWAKPGDDVVLRRRPIMDADFELYVNGVKIDKTHKDSDYWEYIFTMPDEDVVITHRITGGMGAVECVNHVDENGDGVCDDCNHKVEHEHTYQKYHDEISHGWSYTCGCATPPNSAQHHDGNDDGKCDDCEYIMSQSATNAGKVQTTIGEAPSLPQFMSLEVDKRFSLSDSDAVSVDVYMGYVLLNKERAAFSDIIVPVSDFAEYAFVLEINYNNETRTVALDSLNYFEEYRCDMYQDVVQYSKYDTVRLDTEKMTGRGYGFVNLELYMISKANERYYVSAETLYYSVTESEIVFGLVSNPVATEGDPGIITNGWEYREPTP